MYQMLHLCYEENTVPFLSLKMRKVEYNEVKYLAQYCREDKA